MSVAPAHRHFLCIIPRSFIHPSSSRCTHSRALQRTLLVRGGTFTMRDLQKFPKPLLRHASTQSGTSSPPTSPPSTPQRSLRAVLSVLKELRNTDGSSNASSFRKIVALAKPERRNLGIAVGLLLVSSSVSLSIPFTVGKLIDFFASAQPVRNHLFDVSAHFVPELTSSLGI